MNPRILSWSLIPLLTLLAPLLLYRYASRFVRLPMRVRCDGGMIGVELPTKGNVN